MIPHTYPLTPWVKNSTCSDVLQEYILHAEFQEKFFFPRDLGVTISVLKLQEIFVKALLSVRI